MIEYLDEAVHVLEVQDSVDHKRICGLIARQVGQTNTVLSVVPFSVSFAPFHILFHIALRTTGTAANQDCRHGFRFHVLISWLFF